MENKLNDLKKLLEDKLASNVVALDMRQSSPYFDYFIIASVDNHRLSNALIGYVEDLCGQKDYDIKRISGRDSDWVLIDLNDIIIHIFTSEARNKYNLEKLWSDCPTVE